MEIEKLKAIAIEALEDIKAEDIQIMDVREISSITDYMIVASGNSNRQVKALAQNVAQECKKQGATVIGTEGEEKAEWVLVDLGDVIVHVMKRETRELYQLEKLWTSSFSIEREQDPGQE